MVDRKLIGRIKERFRRDQKVNLPSKPGEPMGGSGSDDKHTGEVGLKFPAALSKYLGVDVTKPVEDPLKGLYAAFALSCNERGFTATRLIESYTSISGKRFLDVGCAYGGFLVALSKSGAREVVGIDIDPKLLGLAHLNLEDNGVKGQLYQGDITDSSFVGSLGTFDIITCNDVIEHVTDPKTAIFNISRLMAPDGILLMEIPNKHFVGFLREDGHFKLPGITILDKRDADLYYRKVFSQDPTVGYYHELSWYFYQLMRNEICPKVLLDDYNCDILNLKRDYVDAISFLESFEDPRLGPEIIRSLKVASKETLDHFMDDFKLWKEMKDSGLPVALYMEKEIVLKYNVDFWRVLGIKLYDGWPNANGKLK